MYKVSLSAWGMRDLLYVLVINTHLTGGRMQQKKFYGSLRIISYVVILLMGSSIVYAASISIVYWTGISV